MVGPGEIYAKRLEFDVDGDFWDWRDQTRRGWNLRARPRRYRDPDIAQLLKPPRPSDI